MQRLYEWTQSFKGALSFACFSLLALLMVLSEDEPSMGWAVADAVCVMYWVNVARMAIKGDKGSKGKPVTQDEIDMLKELKREMSRIIVKKEFELLALKAKENDDGTGHTSESEAHKAGK